MENGFFDRMDGIKQDESKLASRRDAETQGLLSGCLPANILPRFFSRCPLACAAIPPRFTASLESYPSANITG